MAKTAPTEQELQDDYRSGVTAKASKWQRKFLAASGLQAAAASESAEAAYQAQMARVLANKQRQKGLAGLSDEDFKASVRAGGPSLYSTPATAKAGKFSRKAMKYVALAVSTANALPARTADPDANIDNRVKPIAKALRNLKTGGT